MDDHALMDWLSAHPLVARYDREDGSLILTGIACIGRGADYRAALRDLIANDVAKCEGTPNARERSAMAST